MELIATDNEAPLQKIHMSIREMIRKGYRENKVAEAHINMALHNNQVIQVRFKPTNSNLYLSSVCHACPCRFITCQAQLTTIRIHAPYMFYKKLKIIAMGPNLRFEIVKTLEEKTVLNNYATTTKTVHNDSFLVIFQSLWTILVVVA